MNIADRYVKGPGWGVWRDSHFKVEGKGVYGLQSAFLVDWSTSNAYTWIPRSFSRSRQLYLIDHAIRYQRSVGALANVVAGYYDGYRRCATEYLHPDALFPADRGPELPVANGGIGRY